MANLKNTKTLFKNMFRHNLCHKILDSAKTSYCLKLKEAFYINSLKPELHTQIQYFNTYLS